MSGWALEPEQSVELIVGVLDLLIGDRRALLAQVTSSTDCAPLPLSGGGHLVARRVHVNRQPILRAVGLNKSRLWPGSGARPSADARPGGPYRWSEAVQRGTVGRAGGRRRCGFMQQGVDLLAQTVERAALAAELIGGVDQLQPGRGAGPDRARWCARSGRHQCAASLARVDVEWPGSSSCWTPGSSGAAQLRFWTGRRRTYRRAVTPGRHLIPIRQLENSAIDAIATRTGSAPSPTRSRGVTHRNCLDDKGADEELAEPVGQPEPNATSSRRVVAHQSPRLRLDLTFARDAFVMVLYRKC